MDGGIGKGKRKGGIGEGGREWDSERVAGVGR